METLSPLPSVTLEPLTEEAFAPFGEVVSHSGGEGRHYMPPVFAHMAEAAKAAFWVSRFLSPAKLPLEITFLEHHPFSAQTFMPLSGQRYIVVVTKSHADGTPDLTSLRAFIAGPGQGICYHQKVWHYSMTVLDAPVEFAVLMHHTGRNDDDVFLELPHPIIVRSPSGDASV